MWSLLLLFDSANVLVLNTGLSYLVGGAFCFGELRFMSELDAQIPTTFGKLNCNILTSWSLFSVGLIFLFLMCIPSGKGSHKLSNYAVYGWVPCERRCRLLKLAYLLFWSFSSVWFYLGFIIYVWQLTNKCCLLFYVEMYAFCTFNFFVIMSPNFSLK